MIRMLLGWIIVSALLIGVPDRIGLQSSASAAEEAVSEASVSTRDVRYTLQNMLMWVGEYNGRIDGYLGPGTIAATKRYQARISAPATGIITPAELEQLIQDGEAQRNKVGFEKTLEKNSGIALGVPSAFLHSTEPTKRGMKFGSIDNSIQVETFKFAPEEIALERIFNRITRKGKKRAVTYKLLKKNWFVATGTDYDWTFYSTAASGENGIRGFSFSYPSSEQDTFGRVAVAMFNSFEAFPDGGEQGGGSSGDIEIGNNRLPIDDFGPSDQGKTNQDLVELSTGSGFVVDEDGHIVTSNHVIAECRRVEVGSGLDARVVSADEENDLAILKMDAGRVDGIATFKATDVKLAEPIWVFGFPLSSLLSGGLNATNGNVSALSGIGDDDRFIQISAAVQPGNSGGPLLDQFGQVSGLVSHRLNALLMIAAAGILPENVNFALRSKIVADFLRARGIAIKAAAGDRKRYSATDIAALADSFTLKVTCYGSGSTEIAQPPPSR